MVYERSVRVLDADSASHAFVMPLGSCIEHQMLMRICVYEMQRAEPETTEANWRKHFVDSSHSEMNDYSRLEVELRSLSVDTALQNAESRLVKLLSDFNTILNA